MTMRFCTCAYVQNVALTRNTRIAELGVAFQQCIFFYIFQKTFLEKKFKKMFFHLLSNFFNFITEKKVKTFFFHIFFTFFTKKQTF